MKQTHSRLPSSQPFDHLVYLRVFEGCNLHCEHCFIPSNPRRFKQEDFNNIPSMLAGKIKEGSNILIQWHGGEPTLMGTSYVKKGIQTLAQHKQFKWRHGIQTNLMTYDKDWSDLYHEYFDSEVGVSWDPKIRLLNKHAKDSHDIVKNKFDKNLSQAIQDGLTPYVVVTAAQTLFDSYPNPFDFFQHWIDRGVSHVHLERITQTGYARQNWNWIGLSNNAYSTQMARWAKAYYMFKKTHPDSQFFLSPFESLTESMESLLKQEPQAKGCWSGHCDTRFHTIDGDGYKAGCTALTSEIGNKNAQPPILNNATFEDKRDLRIFNCKECPFQSICKTGCLALDFDDGSGECSGGKKLFEAIEKLCKTSYENETNLVNSSL